jgi:hypothetical protein
LGTTPDICWIFGLFFPRRTESHLGKGRVCLKGARARRKPALL